MVSQVTECLLYILLLFRPANSANVVVIVLLYPVLSKLALLFQNLTYTVNQTLNCTFTVLFSEPPAPALHTPDVPQI